MTPGQVLSMLMTVGHKKILEEKMKKPLKNYGNWALITGASAGIGLAFSEKLAEEGLNLILIARREDKLKEISKKIKEKYSVEIICLPLDLTKDDFLDDIKKITNDLEIGILVNNAGFGNNGFFINNDPENEANMVRLNCLAPVILTHHFVRPMKKRKNGAIIFLSSIAANQPTPRCATYAATKVFDLFLGEALSYELKNEGIKVVTVKPGATATEFQKTGAFKNINSARKPEDVVNTALKALGKKWTVIDGFGNKILSGLALLGPRKMAIKFAYKWMEKLKLS